jgi:hypothetical protein
MAGFLVLVALGGYLAAMLIWVPAFLLYVSRTRARTVITYTLAASVLVAALPLLLPVDLPVGLLMNL